jgi:hypothetical protein
VERFAQLLSSRWVEAQQRLGIPGQIRLSWEITDDYPHFKTKRGYGVTMWDGKPACHMGYASKILHADHKRADGIVRHEIGHVMDLCLPAGALDQWAASQGVQLPKTVERRADAIAEAIWGEPLSYDKADLVQTTGKGHCPRPKHLGL